MYRRIAIAALSVMIAGGAHAASAESQIRSQLRAQGFSNIQIERDDGRIEVEARRGNQKVELRYDARTGQLVSQRSENVSNRGARVGRIGDDDRRGVGRRGGSDDDDDDGGRRGGRGVDRDDDDDDRGGRGGRGGTADRDDDDDDGRGGRGGGRGGGDRDDNDDDGGRGNGGGGSGGGNDDDD